MYHRLWSQKRYHILVHDLTHTLKRSLIFFPSRRPNYKDFFNAIKVNKYWLLAQNTLKAGPHDSCFLLSSRVFNWLCTWLFKRGLRGHLGNKRTLGAEGWGGVGGEEVVSKQQEARATQPHFAAPSCLPRGRGLQGGGKLPRFLLKAPGHFLPGTLSLVSVVSYNVKWGSPFYLPRCIKIQFPISRPVLVYT